jgi:hypothetical protein
MMVVLPAGYQEQGLRSSQYITRKQKTYFEPIIQVLDFMKELFSSKFQVPGPGALVGE